MERYLLNALPFLAMSISYFAFLVLNSFKNPLVTFARAVVAIALGWGAMLGWLLAENALSISIGLKPSPSYPYTRSEEYSYMVILAPIYSTIIVLLGWLLHGVIIKGFRKRKL